MVDGKESKLWPRGFELHGSRNSLIPKAYENEDIK